MNTQKISASDFADKFGNVQQTIVDLRTPAEHEQESITGCIALPVQELNASSFARSVSSNNPDGGPIYLLCQSGKRADMAASKLRDEEHELIIIEGGLNALKAAGITTVTGNRKTIGLERQVRIAAGSLTVLGIVLGASINPALYGLSAFVGCGLIFAGVTDTCGMAMILARMPWNKASNNATCTNPA